MVTMFDCGYPPTIAKLSLSFMVTTIDCGRPPTAAKLGFCLMVTTFDCGFPPTVGSEAGVLFDGHDVWCRRCFRRESAMPPKV